MVIAGEGSTTTENLTIVDKYKAIIAAKDAEIERLSREASACDMIEEYRQDAQTTADAIGHIQQQFEIVNNDRDDWIACHAKIFRELQETKTLLGNKCAEVERLTRERETWQRSKDAEKRNELREQLAAAQNDAERLDFLDSLSRRTDPSLKKCNWLNSDMHFSNQRVVIHLRDCVGRATTTGAGYSTREAIDAAMQCKERKVKNDN